MQDAATSLQGVADTTVVAYGIGYSGFQLGDIASDPHDENIINVPDLNSLSDGEQQLIDLANSYCMSS